MQRGKPGQRDVMSKRLAHKDIMSKRLIQRKTMSKRLDKKVKKNGILGPTHVQGILQCYKSHEAIAAASQISHPSKSS